MRPRPSHRTSHLTIAPSTALLLALACDPTDPAAEFAPDPDGALAPRAEDPVDFIHERHAARRWRITFEDDFEGWYLGKDPDCFDPTITPPRCATESWYTGPCDPAYWPQLAALDKCVWGVHDRYNFWSFHLPSENGVNKLDPSMVAVHDGKLWLNAGWNPNGDPDAVCDHDHPESCIIFSGGVDSSATGRWVGNDFEYDSTCEKNGFCQRYGRFEVRARIPVQAGAFPAHWLFHQFTDQQQLRPGEIDFMESVDDGVVHGPHHSVHLDAAPGYRMHSKHYPKIDRPQRFAQDFHTYAVEWSPEAVAFFIDGRETGRMRAGDPLFAWVEGTAPPQWIGAFPGNATVPAYSPERWMHFILNTSVAGGYLGDGYSLFQPMTHEIEWVRVYESCGPDDNDPACAVLDEGSAEITNDPWMLVEKWKASLRRAIVGDFDRDGAADLLLQPTAYPGHATYELLADGAGRFAAELDITLAAWMNEAKWYAGYRQILAGDFDGDQDTDLLLRPTGSGHQAYYLRSLGDGTFAPEQTVTQSYGMTDALWWTQNRDAFVTDLDGDQRDDLILVGKTPLQSTLWLRGAAAGGFLAQIDLSALLGGQSKWAQDRRRAVIGDFDGDGQDDVLLQARSAQSPTYLIASDGAGGFDPALDATNLFWMNAAKWADAYREALVGDFDGDGHDDLLLRSRALGHSTYLLTGDPAAVFDHEVTLDVAHGMTPALWLASDREAIVGDFNGDGHDDLILRPAAASAASTLLLPGSAAGFRNVREITEAEALGATQWRTSHSEITVADFDGDGADDLLLRGIHGATVIDPLRNPSEMVDATDSTSDQTYVIYLPPHLFY